MIPGYPVSYEKTLEIAKKEAAFGGAVENAEEIERRYSRIASGEEYTLADLRKETLLDDIACLLQAVVIFLDKVDEMTALAQHRNPKPSERSKMKVHWGRLKG
ncbi:MAG: hypothetical protein PHD37_17265 [Gallionellaceae bacterium]|nr:hypothetical protein [Gallionellaceae bacterium]